LAALRSRELGVSSGYRIWTIVLGILLGIAIIFIIILIIMYVLAEKKLKEEQERELRERERRYNNEANNNFAYDNRHAVSNPLLAQDDWSKPAHPPHAFGHRQPVVETESNHSDAAPRAAGTGFPSTAHYPQQSRREAQV
jgi:hypothetical protein